MEKKKNVKKIVVISILSVFLLALIIAAFSIGNFFLSNKEYMLAEKNINIPILLYHNIVTEQTEPDYMQTTCQTFESQLSGLLNLGYKPITYTTLISYKNGQTKLPEKVFLVAFDDGYTENYTNALPILQKHNIPISIFIIDDTVGKAGYMSWDQIRELSNSGLVDIYTHGKTHAYADTVTTQDFIEDITYAHSHIEQELGKTVTKVFAYPYGVYSDEKIQALADAGFVQNLTDNKINNSTDLDLARLHREYPLSDSVPKIIVKIFYRSIRYGG